jgi:hypothetical protein
MSDTHGAGKDGSGVELGTISARQGETTGRMRWVLAISTSLVIVGFAVVWYQISH